jgi:hypothetical protein
MGRSLTETIRELSRTLTYLREDYRPELHYMRGPGPKWRSKRSRAGMSAGPVKAGDASPVAKIAKAHA